VGILVFLLCLLAILLGLSWIRLISREAHAGERSGSRQIEQRQAVNELK
jgi:hypothetical protein